MRPKKRFSGLWCLFIFIFGCHVISVPYHDDEWGLRHMSWAPDFFFFLFSLFGCHVTMPPPYPPPQRVQRPSCVAVSFYFFFIHFTNYFYSYTSGLNTQRVLSPRPERRFTVVRVLGLRHAMSPSPPSRRCHVNATTTLLATCHVNTTTSLSATRHVNALTCATSPQGAQDMLIESRALGMFYFLFFSHFFTKFIHFINRLKYPLKERLRVTSGLKSRCDLSPRPEQR